MDSFFNSFVRQFQQEIQDVVKIMHILGHDLEKGNHDVYDTIAVGFLFGLLCLLGLFVGYLLYHCTFNCIGHQQDPSGAHNLGDVDEDIVDINQPVVHGYSLGEVDRDAVQGLGSIPEESSESECGLNYVHLKQSYPELFKTLFKNSKGEDIASVGSDSGSEGSVEEPISVEVIFAQSSQESVTPTPRPSSQREPIGPSSDQQPSSRHSPSPLPRHRVSKRKLRSWTTAVQPAPPTNTSKATKERSSIEKRTAKVKETDPSQCSEPSVVSVGSEKSEK